MAGSATRRTAVAVAAGFRLLLVVDTAANRLVASYTLLDVLIVATGREARSQSVSGQLLAQLGRLAAENERQLSTQEGTAATRETNYCNGAWD